VYATGSIGRLEAGRHSDLDVFRITDADRSKESSSGDLTLLCALHHASQELGFPEFTDGGVYLKVINLDEMLKSLGSTADDANNYFTARLLLLLESQPIFNESRYEKILDRILDRYYKDSSDHSENFQAVFLVNDIVRYWKTLCMNYEEKRNPQNLSEEQKAKARVKNLKLKFSRLWTCFSLLIPLSANLQITQSDLRVLVKTAPLDRLQGMIAKDEQRVALKKAVEKYEHFLNFTNKPTQELATLLQDAQQKKDIFTEANAFGESMFQLLRSCASDTALRFLIM
jgi:hypothetical protein